MQLLQNGQRQSTVQSLRPKPMLQGAEEFVEFVGSVEVGFQFAGAEALTKIFDAAGEEIEGGGEDFAIGEDDVAPKGVRAAGEAERVAEAGAGEGDGQTLFIEMVVEERTESHGSELGQMRGEADSVIVLVRAQPERTSTDFFQNFHEGGDAWVVGVV